MSTGGVVAAVDLGASGGRVVAGIVADGAVRLDVVHRFDNGIAMHDGHLRWPVHRLFDEVVEGLARLQDRFGPPASIGIDTWAVDYGLLDGDGTLLADPIAYRDDRTAPAVEAVHALVDAAELFAVNGLQFLPFNTCYQLLAEQSGPQWGQAEHVVLIPDLIAYWLTGALGAEYTNATTTGLVDVTQRAWSTALTERLSVPVAWLGQLQQPGTVRGTLTPDIARRTGIPEGTPLINVGTHDTASAVVGVPAQTGGFAFISCGTWSLVGLELDAPILTDAARRAGFTNEGGVDGTVRFLRNVGGLWLVQECLRAWAADGPGADLTALLAEAANVTPTARFDVDDSRFIAPGDMPARILAAIGERGGPLPHGPAELIRVVLESLADGFARTISAASRLSGRSVEVVHLVGGGARNALLCQLTADATGVPVIAGPVEATALGNVLVQSRALGWVHGPLSELRVLAADCEPLQTWTPRPVRRPFGDLPAADYLR